MIATQIRQKDAFFYFAPSASEKLLQQVRFSSRFHDEAGGVIPVEASAAKDDVARFIAGVERVAKIHRELARWAGLQPRGRG